MITDKIEKRHWVVFFLLALGLISSLVGVALFRGEQYQVVAEEFRWVFYISVLGTIIFAILLVIGVIYLKKSRPLKPRN